MSALEDAGQLPLDLDPAYAARERERSFLAGCDPMAEAIAWKDANPEGYRLLVGWAFRDAGAGRRCSMKYYGELLRKPWQRTATVEGCPYVVNNTALSGLVRILVREFPELEGSFETRRSRADAS